MDAYSWKKNSVSKEQMEVKEFEISSIGGQGIR